MVGVGVETVAEYEEVKSVPRKGSMNAVMSFADAVDIECSKEENLLSTVKTFGWISFSRDVT